MAHMMLIPDPTIVWIINLINDNSIRKILKQSSFVISSSPPESAHIGAYILARKYNLLYIIDMRDGWLDEPLKTYLVSYSLRSQIERKIETTILASAFKIFVTSSIWYNLLCKRIPHVQKNVFVLTNAYPISIKHQPAKFKKGKNKKETIVLIYAGRFLGSRHTQSPNFLFDHLINMLYHSNKKGIIKIIGDLTNDDMIIINSYSKLFRKIHWFIDCISGAVPRDKLIEEVRNANGLLLLANSMASLPSKLFEYIPTKKPIFVVTPRKSAVWKLCEELPQVTLINIDSDFDKYHTKFIDDCVNDKVAYAVPNRFSETYLSQLFITHLRHSH